MKYELMDTYSKNAVIKVIGIGGGGGNAVNHMVNSNIEGVDFICANTDAQALRKLSVDTMVQLGAELTKGLGAGTNPEIGKEAAMEDKDRIKEIIQGTDMVFLTAGMGGGTGTGAIPVFAEIAKELGVLTVAVVTKPFQFEGKQKLATAIKGIEALEEYVDSLIVIPNQKLLSVLGDNISLVDAFSAANDVLQDAVQGITQLIVHPGYINVDFADVKTVMTEMGVAIMGTGTSSGEHRAKEAADKAISCPLLDDINLQGAQGILVNITASQDLGIAEFNEIGTIIDNFAAANAVVKIGTAIDPELGDEIKVTVVATGMSKQVESLGGESPQRILQRIGLGEESYSALDKPAITRKQRASALDGNQFAAQAKKEESEYLDLDIPAFLRRQAD